MPRLAPTFTGAGSRWTRSGTGGRRPGTARGARRRWRWLPAARVSSPSTGPGRTACSCATAARAAGVATSCWPPASPATRRRTEPRATEAGRGSVVGDEHGDAAGGEVGDVGGGGLGLGGAEGSAHGFLGGPAELGDQVVGRLRAVQGRGVAVGEAAHAGDLLGQRSVGVGVVGVEGRWVGRVSVTNRE